MLPTLGTAKFDFWGRAVTLTFHGGSVKNDTCLTAFFFDFFFKIKNKYQLNRSWRSFFSRFRFIRSRVIGLFSIAPILAITQSDRPNRGIDDETLQELELVNFLDESDSSIEEEQAPTSYVRPGESLLFKLSIINQCELIDVTNNMQLDSIIMKNFMNNANWIQIHLTGNIK